MSRGALYHNRVSATDFHHVRRDLSLLRQVYVDWVELIVFFVGWGCEVRLVDT